MLKIKPLTLFAVGIIFVSGIIVQAKQSLQKPEKLSEKPEFINIGPGGGGTARAIVFNPQNPDEIYVALDCGGLHKTIDGGKIWKNINKGVDYDGHINWNKTHSLLLVDENRLFTATSSGKIYRSTDKGENWEIVYQLPNINLEISYLFQSRHNKNTLYALTGKSDTGDMHRKKKLKNSGKGILISRNGGKKGSWERLDIPKGNLPYGVIIMCLEEDATNPDILYAATDMGFYISNDKGKNWTSLQKNIGEYRIKRMITVPGKPGWIFATVGHFKGNNKSCILQGILVSKDYGKTWKKQGTGFQKKHNQFFAITSDPLNPKVLYLGCPQWSGGLYKSTDFGETWKLIYGKSTVKNLNIWHKSGAGPAVTKIVTGGGDKNNDKQSDYLFFLGANSGLIIKSSDSGKTFRQIICTAIDINGKKYWKGNGAIEFLCARSIAVDPFNKNHLFISYYDWNFFESIDGGKSFSKPIGPWFEKELIGSTKEVLFDPERKGTVYFGVARGTTGKTGGIIRKKDGKYKFIAGGGARSKRKIYKGFPASSVYGMALINLTEGGRETRFLYAGANGHGVYRMNVDKKRPAWEKTGTGLANKASKTILCMKAVQTTGTILLGTANGIYKNDNNQWKQLTGPDTKYPFITKVYALDVDSKNTKTIYASVMEKFAETKNNGIYMSSNGGLDWKKISNAPLPYDMTVDQAAATPTLYVASQVLGVYKVYLDSNNKWITESYANKENGLDHTRCWTVDICPLTQKMYIGTHGTGAFMSK